MEVSILKDNVLLTIDTSGSGLNKRGYRLAQGEASKEKALNQHSTAYLIAKL